ncbi:LTA synthase family protein [Kosakonia sacchari]|uniref:Phosphoglycerol transferase MdoB n=1 Tax=Kosakonia sacchari TaxID=1158459 RepID=A0A1G4XQQ7_9ENTR|nr:alkaline phosphatase family protein [Kosakonia sacchari]AHJ73772.1 hypothetical protein C813_02575 [Kosakonia sacchari SP1]SCX43534.1 Phosphoglycerol transferase MdoB [Kosakonia sacchari]
MSLNTLQSTDNIKTMNKYINILLDACFLFIFSLLLNTTLIKPELGLSHFSTRHELIRFGWLASPVLFIYITLRLLRSSAIFSGYLTISIILLLDHINTEKTTLTGEPISFNDLASVNNLSVATKYITSNSTLLFLSFIILGILCFFIGKKSSTTKKHYALLIVSFLITTPLTFSPYVNNIFGDTSYITQKVNLLFVKYNIAYHQWDWKSNVITHGLPIHLVQTSVRESIPSFSENNRETYSTYKANAISALHRPRTIVYILCESCWYDSNNFKTEFQPLINAGFKAFRATSPVYGGGTANAEFEMLTGLPSNSGVLSGIIYQEYSSLLKNNADTLPSNLQHQGARSVAVHNFARAFWHRDIVYQKFGFDKFIALPDMGELPSEYAVQRKPWQWQPDDFLLYRSVLNEISNNNDKPHFFHLVTMSTHGPSDFDNDFGEKAYAFKVRESMSRMIDFTEKLASLDPNALVVVYGDHKPAMNRYFYENKVFPANYYIKKGVKDTDFFFNKNVTAKEYGDVPVFIKNNDEESLNKLIAEANGKPFFCLSAIIDKYFIHSGLPAFNYNIEHGCLAPQDYNYQNMIKITPSWIYALSLFS